MRYRSTWETGPRAVWALILANFAVFIATLFSQQAIGILGVQRDALTSHPWIILTSLFVHAGWWHILGNMFMLYFYGNYLSRLIGENKFLLLYFSGGLVGNVLFLLIAAPWRIAVGASGAVFAIGGALAVIRPRIKVVLFPIPIPMDLWMYVLMTAVLLGLLPALSTTNIGWQAHLGGLAVGLAFGWYFKRWEKRRGIYR